MSRYEFIWQELLVYSRITDLPVLPKSVQCTLRAKHFVMKNPKRKFIWENVEIFWNSVKAIDLNLRFLFQVEIGFSHLKERKLSIINTLINVFPDIKEIEVLPPILSSLVFAKGIEKAKTSEGFSYVFKYTHAYKLNP
jgi:hypothetical protein